MIEFEIMPFVGALPLKFGMTAAEVSGAIGQPHRSSSNWLNVLEYDYSSATINLTIGFGGEAVTADHFGFGRGSRVCFRGLDFFSDRTAWRHLLNQSSDYHECLGFLVFCDLGIALSGFHDDYADELAVVVFPHGTWEKFRGRFKPFELRPEK